MHYLHHNFYSNFTSSIDAGESEMTKDIFINEISDFIVYETPRLIEAMKKAGLDVREADSDEELIEIIYKSLGNNQNLANMLAFIIAEANQLINNGTTTGDASKVIIKKIASGILIVGKDIRTEEGAKAFKADVLEHIYSKSKSKGDYRRTILRSDKSFGKIGYYILGAYLILGITIFIANRIQKKKQLSGLIASASMPLPLLPDATLGAGGNIPPAVAPIVAPPVTLPTPVPEITPTPITTAPIAPIQTANGQ